MNKTKVGTKLKQSIVSENPETMGPCNFRAKTNLKSKICDCETEVKEKQEKRDRRRGTCLDIYSIEGRVCRV